MRVLKLVLSSRSTDRTNVRWQDDYRIEWLGDQLARPDDYVVLGDNADVLPALPDKSFQLIYIDPPSTPGRSSNGSASSPAVRRRAIAVGSGGTPTPPSKTGRSSYNDEFDDYLGFLRPRLEQAHRLLADDGTLYFHIDYREAHYCKILLDEDVRPRVLPQRGHLGL